MLSVSVGYQGIEDTISFKRFKAGFIRTMGFVQSFVINWDSGSVNYWAGV